MIKNKKLLPIIGAVVFASFFTNIEVFLYRIMPTTFWFEYQDVVPENPYYIGEELKLVSIANFKREVDVIWVDRLKCVCNDNNCDSDGYDTFSTYISRAEDYKPETRNINWLYQGVKPLHETQCYIESEISIDVPGGRKTQKINGSVFDVKVLPEQKQEVFEIKESIEEIKEVVNE